MNYNSLLKIAAGPFAVLALHIIATVTGLYQTFWWFDIPMHFLGGFFIAACAAYMLDHFQSTDQYRTTWKPLHLFLLLGLTALAAVTWEMMEFSFDEFFGSEMQPGLVDTIKDLSMGMIGGGLAAIIASFRRKK